MMKEKVETKEELLIQIIDLEAKRRAYYKKIYEIDFLIEQKHKQLESKEIFVIQS